MASCALRPVGRRRGRRCQFRSAVSSLNGKQALSSEGHGRPLQFDGSVYASRENHCRDTFPELRFRALALGLSAGNGARADEFSDRKIAVSMSCGSSCRKLSRNLDNIDDLMNSAVRQSAPLPTARCLRACIALPVQRLMRPSFSNTITAPTSVGSDPLSLAGSVREAARRHVEGRRRLQNPRQTLHSAAAERGAQTAQDESKLVLISSTLAMHRSTADIVKRFPPPKQTVYPISSSS